MPRRKKAFSGTVNDVDLRLMRVFKTVIECGGLSAAQTELGVGRSTISRQISDLETRLGMRLCHRGRSGFYLTQQGQQAYEFIDHFLKQSDDFTSRIASISNKMVGKIEIGMIDFTMSDVKNPLIRAIRAFQDISPDVSINMMTGSPNEVERGVIDGKLHIGIVPDYQRHPSLNYMTLYDERVGLFCGGNHPLVDDVRSGAPLSDKDVCRHKLVHRAYFESERLRKRKQIFPVGSTVYQTEAVLSLVRSGAYLGYFPSHCQDLFRDEFYEILPDVFSYSTPICAVWRTDRNQSAILQDFLDLLKP
ncbi:LysR family transcriptional regulator [Sulfitobacter geojensis]|uniref:LysR family transcriptional regulator n=1 Tax=Sulfitobacter geojensis TaxID=1342299 RepID=A0AAE3B7B2_9RHOB|nr:LysR family transcriptional regulator [Sulfitobacter geojensis]MBM1689975.1 LysR family transcriptional regulator [Sulfitobacter geojensis]MBM1694041.1 LysR family transcriptional regulator [Sulfitobacter geojensis]MBM1706207.1 LysR family transcriptional regulator [Sulfitobacter geojensis]MBM1710265.1 LysR family transcriptional regulator [Sulfitobacter geojensis]MBM1714331.1 LysR family transcriptional regulator [Sulfitobacter geojensis]